jgi:hypothetical protein
VDQDIFNSAEGLKEQYFSGVVSKDWRKTSMRFRGQMKSSNELSASLNTPCNRKNSTLIKERGVKTAEWPFSIYIFICKHHHDQTNCDETTKPSRLEREDLEPETLG